MKIVIDISENDYELACRWPDALIAVYAHAIKNGIPLPKGHGDLIDKKELLRQPMDLANYPSNYVRIAPTIIEADKSESKDKV